MSEEEYDSGKGYGNEDREYEEARRRRSNGEITDQDWGKIDWDHHQRKAREGIEFGGRSRTVYA